MITLSDGTSFVGLYKYGFLNGPGKITRPDGTVETEDFDNGSPSQHVKLLSYDQVTQRANHYFAGDPEKDDILQRIESILKHEDIKNVLLWEYDQDLLSTGKILYGIVSFINTRIEKKE